MCDPLHRSSVGQDCRSSVSESSHLEQGSRSSVSQSSHSGQDSRSSVSQSSRTVNFQGGWGDVVRLIKNDLSEQGYLSYSSNDELFEPVYRLERVLRQQQQAPNQQGEREKRLIRHSSVREASTRTWQGERLGRAQSFSVSEYSGSRCVRSEDRRVRRYNSSCSDSRSGDGQRHVHFQENVSHSCTSSQRAFTESHGGSREQEVGGYLVSSHPGRGEMGHSLVYPTTVNGGQHQTHPKCFKQSTQVRNIHQGDVQIGRRAFMHEVSRSYSHDQANAVRSFDNPSSRDFRAIEEEEPERGSYRVQGEYRQRAHSLREERRREVRESRRYRGNHRERRVWQDNEEESSSTEEEEVGRERRREERRAWRLPHRNNSVACRDRSSRAGNQVLPLAQISGWASGLQ